MKRKYLYSPDKNIEGYFKTQDKIEKLMILLAKYHIKMKAINKVFGKFVRLNLDKKQDIKVNYKVEICKGLR